MNIEQRSALVTGGSGDIGRAIAAELAAEGMRVAVTSRGGDVDGSERSVALDLADPAAASAGAAAAIDALGGRLDTLVHAAVRWPALGADRFEDVPRDEWQAMLRANVEGTFALVQAALPALRGSGSGRIVLLSSGIAEEGHPPTVAYAAAKASLHGLCRALAWDAGRDGVLVNVIAVGYTRTEGGLARFGPDAYDRASALIPQRRVSVPEDVARLAAFLGSERNTSVTGEIVREGTSAARTALVGV
jgi:NAD(P)-dependent dehydrogenase (short-subunit alcohol dehydrogenase family)